MRITFCGTAAGAQSAARAGSGIHVKSPEGRLLIVQQEHGGAKHWGPLGGALEFGETIEECALREAYEESGLRLCLIRLLSVDQFWHAGKFQGVGFHFLAEPDPWPQEVRPPEFDGTTPFFLTTAGWRGRRLRPTAPMSTASSGRSTGRPT